MEIATPEYVIPTHSPWSEINDLNLDGVQEQLLCLCRILESQGQAVEVGQGALLVAYALHVARATEAAYVRVRLSQMHNAHGVLREQQQKALSHVIQEGEQLLARLLHLVNHRGIQVVDLLDQQDERGTAQRITEQFEADPRAFTGISKVLQSLADEAPRKPLQQTERVVDRRLHLEIAQMLLLRDGQVNYGLVPVVKRWVRDVMLKGKAERVNSNLYYALKNLYSSSELRRLISEVRAPESMEAYGSLIIKAALGLPQHQPVTDQHARQAVVAGLFTHYRQGDAGSCFASSLCIELMTSTLERCVQDWTELLTQDGLVRNVAGTSTLVPYQLRLHTENSCRSFPLAPNGTRGDTAGNSAKRLLINDPGLQAIRLAFGIKTKDFEEIFKRVLSGVCPDPSDVKDRPRQPHLVTTSMDQILGLLARELDESKYVAHIDSITTADRLIHLFESRTQDPLVAAWDNCLANMSEVESGKKSHVRGKLCSAVGKALKDSLRSATDDSVVIEVVASAVTKEIGQRAQYLYDLHFCFQEAGSAKRDVNEAFVLFDTLGQTDFRKWTRVSTPRAFQGFIKSCIDSAESQMGSSGAASRDGNVVSKAYNRLVERVWEESFIAAVLANYPKGDKAAKYPASEYMHLKHTPWVDRCGNIKDQVLKVYFELDYHPLEAELRTNTAEHLLSRLIDYVRGLSPTTLQALRKNHYSRIPVSAPTHECSLMLGSPTFVAAWSSPLYGREWIEQQLIEPGRAIARSTLSRRTGQAIVSFCRESLLEEKMWPEFDRQLQRLPAGIWVCDFRDRLEMILKELIDLSGDQLEELHTAMFEALPEFQQRVLTESAVTFADSNWTEGLRDQHFAFMYNPFSDRLEIWKRTGEREVAAMDQSKWTMDRSWQFYKNALELIPQ